MRRHRRGANSYLEYRGSGVLCGSRRQTAYRYGYRWLFHHYAAVIAASQPFIPGPVTETGDSEIDIDDLEIRDVISDLLMREFPSRRPTCPLCRGHRACLDCTGGRFSHSYCPHPCRQRHRSCPERVGIQACSWIPLVR
jgi:hypothetical protein